MSQHAITPAFNNPGEEMPTEMSAEEFQKRLFGWFEDRGLLSELRAHLRKQMIGALKDTSIGHTMLTQQKQSISPKVQALNLLVGEYLLCYNYHYSLSVFSTEVPLMNMLPEVPLCLNPTDRTSKCKEWKFHEKDAWDILETLGISRDSDVGQSIYHSYYHSEPQPLLRCIIKFTNASTATSNACCTYEGWLKSIGEILHSNNIGVEKIKEILTTVIGLVETERKRIGKELQGEYAKLLKELAEEQKKLAKDTTKEPQENEVKILKHKRLLQDRYHHLIIREREVHKKEHQLQKQQECLEAQHHHLQSGFESLHRDQMTVKQLQKQLQQEVRDKQITAESDAAFLENLQKECKDMKNQIVDTQEALLNVTMEEPQTQQDLITQLQIQNKALQTVNAEQRTHIDELTERSSLLLRDLESTQVAVNILTNNNRVGILTAPPLIAPPSLSLGIRNTFVNGGGEDRARTIAPPTPREYKNLPNARDIKRRPVTRRTSQLNWSTSDESTPSNNLLQEARDRLRRLEEESEEVDRHYQQFKLKRAQEGYSFQFHPRHTTWDLSKENTMQNEFGPIPTTSTQLTSACHLMEYNPQNKSGNLSENYFSESRLHPRLRSATAKRLENVACKDTNVSVASSGLDALLAGDMSSVSVSPIESSDDKSELVAHTSKD